MTSWLFLELKNIDTLSFCHLLNITKEDYIKNCKETKSIVQDYLPYFTNLNKSEFAAFQEKIRKFEGFYFQNVLRDYEVDFGANVFWIYHKSTKTYC
jgi:penicillin-binding protein 2